LKKSGNRIQKGDVWRKELNNFVEKQKGNAGGLMGIEDVKKNIRDAKVYLEDYRMFGSIVTEAMDSLDRLDELIADPTEAHLVEGRKIAEELNDSLKPYRMYVPTLAEYMDQLLEWLKSQ
jgi:hypothetical protein